MWLVIPQEWINETLKYNNKKIKNLIWTSVISAASDFCNPIKVKPIAYSYEFT